jgi:hypothetical protein
LAPASTPTHVGDSAALVAMVRRGIDVVVKAGTPYQQYDAHVCAQALTS